MKLFSQQELDHLAFLAEEAAGQAMNDHERYKFDDELNEAAIDFLTPDHCQIPSAEQGKKLSKIADDLQKTSKAIIKIMSDLQRPFIVEGINSTILKIRVISDESNSSPGRPSKEKIRIMLFVSHLSRAWTVGARKPAGTTTTTKVDHRGGKFVQFVRDSAHALEPAGNWDKKPALGDTIRKALSEIRKTMGR